MAVSGFKSEFNWSDYQDKQLSVLQSLEKSFSSSLSTSKVIESSLSKLSTSIDNIFKSTRSLLDITSSMNSERRRGVEATRQFNRGIADTASTIDAFNEKTKQNLVYIDQYGRAIDYTAQKQKELADAQEQEIRRIEELNRAIEEQRRKEYQRRYSSEIEAGTLLADSYESTIGQYIERDNRERATITAAIERVVEKFGITQEHAASLLASIDSDRERAEKQAEDAREKALNLIESKLLSTMKYLGEQANKYSEISNKAIHLSGERGSNVREFRSEFVDMIADLNKDTGYAYNGQQSYANIVEISQGVTSSLEAITEMSKPLLLAQESLDVNMTSVADIFNRFYTRYKFSSSNMEDTLNQIRGNTAGNSANAEATMENIKSLENWINIIAGDNNDLREELLGEISNYTSWLESMGVESKTMTQWLKDISFGDFADNRELLLLLNKAGLSGVQAQDMARSGQYEELTEAILGAISSVYDSVKDSRALGTVLDNYGVPRDLAMEAYNVMNSSGWTSLEEFIEDSKGKAKMDELVEDKYVSAADKANNYLSTITDILADWQEKLGFGLSDIAGAYIIGKAAWDGVNTLMKGFGLGGGGAASPGGVGGGAAGGFKISGAGIAKAGGIAAGAYMAFDGAKDLLSEETDAAEKALSAVELGGGAVGAGALLLGASNPIGWAALAIGGVALLGKSMYRAATTIGEVDAIKEAYEEAKKKVLKANDEHMLTLSEIASNLDKYDEMVAAGGDLTEANNLLEEQRKALIDLGILSENDIETARKANKEGLEKLTQAYLDATGDFGSEYDSMMSKYSLIEQEAAADMKEEMIEVLQEWNDGGKLKQGTEENDAVARLFKSVYDDMSSRDPSKLTENDKKTLKNLEEVLEDGKITKAEANQVIDEGWFNTTLQNSNLGDLYKHAGVMKHAGEAGEDAYSIIVPNDYYHYDEAEVSEVAELLARANNATNEASKVEVLDELKAKGYTSEHYSEIGDLARELGLPVIERDPLLSIGGKPKYIVGPEEGYAVGTNYIPENQLALVHEGEAIVPKKYNPAVNSEEFKKIYAKLQDSQYESKEASEDSRYTMIELVQELREIRKFLALWKQDSEVRDRVSSFRDRYASSKNFIQNYMST